MKALTATALTTLAVMGLAWVIRGVTLAGVALFCLVVQWMAFPVVYALGTEAFYDLTGSLTFLGSLALCTWLAGAPGGW